MYEAGLSNFDEMQTMVPNSCIWQVLRIWEFLVLKNPPYSISPLEEGGFLIIQKKSELCYFYAALL
ncbi:hypothetical protein D5281_10870 [bacterium 1xD42-62]|uniref:Uncharacterized protein n=1 Tax=Parablautia muri TaxID=2320879 RepID=A0A9X5GSH9_9FIRM|nr:hypothetical protein [Parablautia muri]